jgi:hypothetical protein
MPTITIGFDSMAPEFPRILHFLGRQANGQWIVSCLDFDLSAQDDTFEGAKHRIEDQIETYVETAMTLDGGVHAEQLLSRKAPFNAWLLFYLGSTLQFFHGSFLNIRGYQESFQYQCA